jgi:signal transduction histidine kinase
LGLITRVQAAQDQLHQLYEDIRRYAEPIRLTYRDCDLSTVWREAWADLAHLRCGRTATLREEIGGSAMRVSADPSHLGIVFRNLLENALAAASDPVEIVVQAGPSELEDRPAVRVSVRDNGPGLDSEQSRRAFEPFYTTKAKGTGLGLAIARRIVELHGGRIAMDESRRTGAELQITLPVSGPRVGHSELGGPADYVRHKR